MVRIQIAAGKKTFGLVKYVSKHASMHKGSILSSKEFILLGRQGVVGEKPHGVTFELSGNSTDDIVDVIIEWIQQQTSIKGERFRLNVEDPTNHIYSGLLQLKTQCDFVDIVVDQDGLSKLGKLHI